MILRQKGKILNGKLMIADSVVYHQVLHSLEGRTIEFSIKELHEDTTMDQHAYYRGPVSNTALSSETFGGWTKADFHSYMQSLFLTETVVKHGKEFIVIKSTSDLGVKKMSLFIEQVIQYLAHEHQIIVPEINTVK